MKSTKQDTPIWSNETRRIGDLVDWEKNPRRLTAKQANDLRDSLKKYGYIEPIQINTDNRIIGGHMRKNVLLQRLLIDPNTEIDVRVPNRTLSEKECEEVAIRLNKNSGEFDWDILANEFEVESLIDYGFEPKELGMEDETSPAQKKEKQILPKDDDSICTKCKRPF